MKLIKLVQQLKSLRQIAACYSKSSASHSHVNHMPNELRSKKVNQTVKYCHSLKSSLFKHRVTKKNQLLDEELWNQHANDIVKLLITLVMSHEKCELMDVIWP